MASRSLDLKALFPPLPPGSAPSDGAAEGAASGARLMALLKQQLSSLDTSGIDPSMPPTLPKLRGDDSVGSGQKGGSGRVLVGSHIVYDCDIRVPEESQPQLEVTPITKYVSEALLSPGRQIAVNRNYICYALRQGQIRILNMNSAVRALLKGHTQRVTDMAFFSDDVHLLASASMDGVVMVRRLAEMEIDGRLAIHQQLLASLQLSGPWGEVPLCPLVCWLGASQTMVAVACASTVFLLTLPELSSTNTWETPLPCVEGAFPPGLLILSSLASPIMCLVSGPSLAVGCEDGQVVLYSGGPKIVKLPTQHQAVHSVQWVGVGEHPLLLTGGPANSDLKLWADGGEGWRCTQTLELVASLAVPSAPAFYNHVCALPSASMILVGNACRPAIYAVQVVGGRMEYLAEFAVTMPILSFTARCEGEEQVQLFCVQTEAIQMYTLKLEDCRAAHLPLQDKEEVLPKLEPQPESKPGPEPQPKSQPPSLVSAPLTPPPSSPPPPLSALLLAPATPHPPSPPNILPPLHQLPLPSQPPPAPSSSEDIAKGAAPGSSKNRKAKPKHISLPPPPPPAPLPVPSPSLPPPQTAEVQTAPLHPALHAAMEEVVAGQQELGLRLSALISAPVAKEGKRVEAAVGVRVERALKAVEEAAAAKREEDSAWRESLRVSLVGEVEAVVTEQVRLGLERLGREVEAVVRSSLQEAMRASFAGVLVPAVERGCGAMVQQVQAVLEELRQEAGEKAAALPLHAVEETLDPTLHLTRLLAEHKYQEAFSAVLNNSEVPIAWVCSQLDPVSVLPVLDARTQLVLAVQLGWDLKEEEEAKVSWLLQLVPLLNPSDPEMAPHMRGMLTTLYNKLHTQLPNVSPHQAPSLRLVVHVINSLLTACK